MFAKNRLTLAVTAAMGVAAAGLLNSGHALAQGSDETVIEEVVVTGSRISRNPETYMGGMAIAAGDDIEKIGSYNTLDLLQKLPAIGSQGTGRNQANGGRGANFVEIHNLEAERTLVLMDGRRVVPTIRDSLGLAVDIQSFPANMIDRIEVLADGASAVYGSDAVAGVVNVIMKNDFEGFEISGGYGEPSEDGGEARNLGMLFGVQGARGRIVAGGTFVETENVDYLERDWSKIPILGEASDGAGGKLILMGSGIPPQGRALNAGIIFEPDQEAGTSYSPYDTFGFSGLNGCPSDGSLDAILCTNHRFNYNDPGGDGVSLINGARVFNFGTLAEVDFDNGFSAYTSILAQHREGRLNFTPLPVQGAAGRFTDLLQVPFDNPNIPADALEVIRAAELEINPDAEQFQIGYRGLDLGNRRFDYDTDTMQATLGLRGDFEFFGSGWSADLWGTWGQSRLTEVTDGQVNVNNMQIALDPARCAQDSSCPKDLDGNPTFDPFGRGPKSEEEIAYILFEDHEKTEYEMYHIAATISTGDLFTLPAGGLGFAAGIEYRDEYGSVTPSGTVADGNSGGNFAEATKGGYDLYEIYAEIDIPILSGLPFAEELGVEAATRFSDYGDFDETTWKVGLRWAPFEMLTFRTQASTGFRAPNVLELYGGAADNFIGVTDPCNAVIQASNPTIAANCAAQGVPATFVQPAAQLKVTQGGNPDLEPETSDNFTIGLVLAPEIWGNPRIAIDYYDVQVDGAISTPNAADVINTCYETPGLAASECARIGRGPGNDVVRFDLLLENLNEIKTSGYDMNATFAWDTPIGVLSADWLVTYLDEWVQTTDTGVEDDRTGKVACDVCDFVGYPEWKSALTGTLSQNNWSVSLAWRYIDEMEIDDQIGFDELNPKADEVHYFDLYGAYNWDNIQISVGMENFTDEEPPFVPSISANTAPIYDWLGRFYYARVKFSF